MDPFPKTVLILHASAGDGHKAAALALEEAARSLYPQAKIETCDALDFFPAWLKKAYAGIYLFMIHKAPFLWGWSYEMSDSALFAGSNGFLRRLFNGYFAAPLARKILAEQPDVIFSTHFLAPEVLANLRRRRGLKSRCVTVITDFLVHRFWVFKETDAYAVATPQTKDALVQCGIPADKIHVTGIPVRSKFGRIEDAASVRQRLGLTQDRFTVLVTSGGSGAGPVARILETLSDPQKFQVLVVCGRNAELLAQMQAAAVKHPHVKPYPFVTNMDELMDASDLVVGKAGGLTLSEALAKRKIFFVLSPVPGQETRNARLLEDANAAVWVKDLSRLQMIRTAESDPVWRDHVLAAVDTIRRPYAARDVAALAQST